MISLERTRRLPFVAAGLVASALWFGSLQGQTIPNPSFEANSFSVAPGLVSDNGPITGWSVNFDTGAGLNPAGGSSPFADNGAVPDGANVAFIQSGFTTLSTTIEGLTVGTAYRMSFRANAPSNQTPSLTIYLDGVPVFPLASPITIYTVGGLNPYAYLAFDFVAGATAPKLDVVNEDSGTSTLLVDAFTIAPSSGRWAAEAWNDDASSGVDPNYVYTHAYSFGGGVGTVINGVPFTGVAGGSPAVAGSFSTTFLGNLYGDNDPNAVTGGSEILANHFVYGGTVPAGSYQSITMEGLTPGTEYIATIYTVGWEAPSPTVRWATFSVGEDRMTLNQDELGNDAGLRISYRYTADATGTATLRIAPVNPANMSIHVYGFSNREAVSRNVAPEIMENPRGTTVAQGESVSFSVVATGIPAPSYQWRRNGSNIAGATEAVYTIPAIGPGDAGSYDVVVSNSMGSKTSTAARLVVGMPMSNPSFEVDTFFVFPGYVSGNGPITGWTALDNHGLNPADGSPFANNGLIPHGVNVAFMQGDGSLSQVVSGFAAGSQYYLHYYENSRSGYNAPSLEVKLGGATLIAAHSVPAVGSGAPYREVYSDVFTASATDLELAFVKSNPLGGDTTAVIDNVAFVPVPAGTAPAITVQPLTQIASVGDTVVLSVQAIGTIPMTYQWSKDGTALTGETGPTLTLAGLQKPAEGEYTVTVGNGAGSVNSAVARLTVFEPIPDLYNTGVDAGRNVLADGAVDPHYKLMENPDTGSQDAIVEESTAFPIVGGPWLANTTVSKWIGPRFNTAASAIGFYTYRTTINIVDRDPSTVIIIGQWASDNAGRDIRVNGVSTGNPQTGGFAAYTPFTIDASNATFVAGENTIDFVVENEAAIGYTGLRVNILRSNLKVPTGVPPTITTQPAGVTVAEGDPATFTGAAEGTSPLSYQWRKDGVDLPGQTGLTLTIASVTLADAGSYTLRVVNAAGSAVSQPAILNVAYRVIPGIFGTGVAADGTLAPGGSVDPHYTVTLSADEFFPGPDAIVLNDAWPIGVWLPHGPKSKWISVQESQATGNLPGAYTFRTTFDLTGYDPAKVRLEGAWGIDNDGLDIVLNGNSTGLTAAGFGGLVPFTITGGFVAGVNTLDFLISNAGEAVNPMGLRVDLRGLLSIAAPARPQLQITRAGDNLSISWAPVREGQKLQVSPAVSGPWDDVQNPANPYTTTATGAGRYFRIIE